MALKAIAGGKKSVLEGIEAFVEKFVDKKLKEARIEERLAELKKALKLEPSAPPAKARGTRGKGKKKPVVKKKPVSNDPLVQLLGELERHPRKAALLKAGQRKDQLLRSLVPLYLGQTLNIEVTSGTTSRFWAKHNVTFAPPNAAKALREHKGFARRGPGGPKITPAGVRYVEAAL